MPPDQQNLRHPSATLQATRFVTDSGLGIAADVGGPEAGHPVILLHGGGQTRHSWKSLAQALVKSGHRVTNIDLRGHGDSDWAADGDYRLDAMIGDLRQIIARQHAAPMLVGASLGGITALLTAGESSTDNAAIISGIALVDIVPRVEKAGSDAILRFMNANPDGFASLDEAAAAVAAYLPHRPRPPSNAGLMKNLRQRDNGRFYWHWDPRLLDERHAEVDSDEVSIRMENAARNIGVPVLLVRGSKSDLVSMDGVQHFLKLIPSASFVDVQNAAHMVAGDMNDVFSQAIIDFMRERLL